VSTSAEAHDSIKDEAPYLRRIIETYIKRRKWHGATCDEVEVALGMRHQTASARFTELKAAGHIFKDGRRRETRSGRTADVYVVREYLTLEGVGI
jgi:hypothetical protein